MFHRPSRVQSSPGPRTTTAESVTPQPTQPRPVTAAVLPSQDAEGATGTTTRTESAPKPDSKEGSAIQLSDLQNILSGLGGN